MPSETRPHLPISMDEPSCPPCHQDCCQSETCPNRLKSASDRGECQLMNVLLVLTCCWLLALVGLLWVALR